MIAVDTQLLVYAHRKDSKWYDAAHGSLGPLIEGNALWAIPWPCIHEFLAIVTHPKIYQPATDPQTALGQIATLVDSSNLVLLSETGRYFDVLEDQIAADGVVGPKVHDARIAALCIHHGVRQLWTADRDFFHFPRLETLNPLVEAL